MVGNLEILRFQTAPISRGIAKAVETVREADRLATLDWLLWMDCDGADSADLPALNRRFNRALEHIAQLQDYLNFLLGG